MRNPRLTFSALSLSGGLVAVLAVAYIGLIAVVMSYATLTIEFAQSVRNDESSVAALEEEYLSVVAKIMATDYTAANYTTPAAKTFVRTTGGTALR